MSIQDQLLSGLTIARIFLDHNIKIKEIKNMLRIKVLPGENIERALKRYKRKVRNVKQMDEVRERKHYTKKSLLRREINKKAKYRQLYLNKQENEL
ncbi:30S ribosomal protein S21 [Eudoraea adriatica]|uniref:30S ribosomal protein S21 n=1 Tax=Eudoraea adriatica TaxID=446681 RepID=UPI0029351B1C|nr:30S ribosomal protein S21 [Eudoraea adriatica]